MKYNVKSSKNPRKFSQLSIGELFLDEDDAPYIKIGDVADDTYGDIYNGIRLSTGDGWNFREDDMVFVPSNYELKILV